MYHGANLYLCLYNYKMKQTVLLSVKVCLWEILHNTSSGDFTTCGINAWCHCTACQCGGKKTHSQRFAEFQRHVFKIPN